MAESDLKPCPFCGGRPYFSEMIDNSLVIASCALTIFCTECGVRFLASCIHDTGLALLKRRQITRAWNRRTTTRQGK